MAGTNDFLEFADGGGANVMSQATYAALSYLTTGVVTGLADPTQANKTWRQATVIAGLIGRFISGQNFNAVDDGNAANLLTAFQNALRAYVSVALAPVVGATRNLNGSAAGGTKTATWTVDEIIAETALGGTTFKGVSLTFNFDGTTTGAGGMDTGTVPTSGDLFFYAIFNPTTVTWSVIGTISGSGAAIYGGTHMPAGYTASTLIGASKTTSATPGNIVQFAQRDRKIAVPGAGVLSGGTATSPTSISLSTAVPVNARSVTGVISTASASGDFSPNNLNITTDSGGILDVRTDGYQSASAGGGGAVLVPFSDLLLTTAQTIWYNFASRNTGTAAVSITGYTI